jgi:hypothetical protein
LGTLLTYCHTVLTKNISLKQTKYTKLYCRPLKWRSSSLLFYIFPQRCVRPHHVSLKTKLVQYGGRNSWRTVKGQQVVDIFGTDMITLQPAPRITRYCNLRNKLITLTLDKKPAFTVVPK